MGRVEQEDGKRGRKLLFLSSRLPVIPLALLLLSTCAPKPPAPPPPAAAPAAPPAANDALFRYEVVAGEGARELAITAIIPPNSGAELELDEGADRFVTDLEGAAGGPIWRLPACPQQGCQLRYRFALADAARAIDEIDVAAERAGVFLSPPSAWLLHPSDPVDGQRFHLHVKTPPGIAFATGLFPAPSGAPDEYEAEVENLFSPPYSAFGELRRQEAEIAGTRVEIVRLKGPLDLPDEALRSWVTGAVLAVHDYYGRPLISRALVLVEPTAGSGIGFSLTMGNGGASVLAPVGRQSTLAELDGAWQLIHELLHVAFPLLPREQRWFAEGVATYVEPILRARRGIITKEEAFNRLFRRMAFGLPGPGDMGLDRTHTWGRTYWGGALFCLLADIEIRTRTQNRRSFDDALRAILAAGGNVASSWEIARTIAAGDAGTSVPVLAELYAKMARAPAPVDLDRLWKRLGVLPSGASVAFDEEAELAAIRRAIVASPPR